MSETDSNGILEQVSFLETLPSFYVDLPSMIFHVFKAIHSQVKIVQRQLFTAFRT